MGIGVILIPVMPTLPTFFFVVSLVGFGAAGYDTAQIVWIIEMWENNAAAYIQTQHFCYALGTFVSPLLLKPFLPPETEKLRQTFSSNETSALHSDPTVVSKDASQLYIPFFIGGVASILGGFLIFVLYWIKKYEKPSSLKRRTQDGEEDRKDGFSKSCNVRKLTLITLSAVVIGTYQGMELCTFQFYPTFTHFIDLNLSQQEGALVVSGMTGAFTLGRAIGIVIVLKVLPEILLLGNVLLILTGNTLLFFFANDSLPVLWGANILLGLGFSTVFPSFYGYIEKHLKVSNVVGAVMIVAGGLVSSLYPVLIGSFIEENPFILIYTNYFSLAASTTAFLVTYAITFKNGLARRTSSISLTYVQGTETRKISADAALETPLKSK